MTTQERKQIYIDKIIKKLNSNYVTIQMLEKIFNIVNNA